ncbi:MAG: LCP family protein [Spirochaetales bacterium]|nr:LCP family protein [Spirochaetales bacterium]
MSKKAGFDQSFILLALIIIIVTGIVIVGVVYFRSDVMTDRLSRDQPFNVLFTVSDEDGLRFMECFFYHPGTKKAGLLHIPPNLGGRIEKLDRVDAISVLYKKHNLSPLKTAVEKVLATDILFYISISYENILKITDLLEGLVFFISNPVDLVFDGHKVLVPSGSVKLDGDKVVDYLRYKAAMEDPREEIWRKQEFIQSLFKRMGEAEIHQFLQDEKAFDYFFKLFDTNISARDFQAFLKEMTIFDSEHIIKQRVEGKLEVVEGVSEELLFPHTKGEYLRLNVQQLEESIASNEAFNTDALVVTMEILNGTERTGLARSTAILFESFGYDVLKVGNTDENEEEKEKTQVIDHRGNPRILKELADIIKCTNIVTEIDLDENQPDITLILGLDFNGRHVQ